MSFRVLVAAPAASGPGVVAADRCDDASDAVAAYRARRHGLVIVDARLPGAVSVVTAVRETDADGVTFVAAVADGAEAAEALAGAAADGVWIAPDAAEIDLLVRTQWQAWHRRRARADYVRALHVALDHVADAVEIADPDSRLVYVNRAFERLTGYARADAVGRTPAELVRSPDVPPEQFAAIERELAAGRTWCGELLARRADGSRVYEDATIVPVAGDGGLRSHIVAIKRDVFERRGYEAMVEAAADAMLVVDFETARFLACNRAAERMLGYTRAELAHLTGRMLSPPSEADKVSQISRDLSERGRAGHPRLRIARKDGSVFWAAVKMQVYTLAGRKLYVAIMRDVSEWVAAERQLSQAAHLASLGSLAGALAHEVNNPAHYVKLNLGCIQDMLPSVEPSEVRRELDEIVTDCLAGMARIERVTRELRPFAAGGDDAPRSVDVNAMVERARAVTANQIRHRAQLEVDLAPLPPIVGQPGGLAQMFTSLLLGAAFAIDEGNADRHRIRIASRLRGDVIEVDIVDTGEPRTDVDERAFDPFFTARTGGEATGVSLSLAAETARAHGGTVRIVRLDDGTTCTRVSLPVDNTASAVARSRPIPIRGRPVGAGRPRLLMIDDEELVLRAYERAFGGDYDVVVAASGEEAIARLERGDQFDAILCDLMMPRMDGASVFEEIAARWPHLVDRVVFCSGGAFTPRAEAFAARVSNPVLHKPLTVAAVAQVLTELLAGRR